MQEGDHLCRFVFPDWVVMMKNYAFAWYHRGVARNMGV